MNTVYAIKKITDKPVSRLTSLYGKLALDRAHLELALRQKNINELRSDLNKLNGVTSIAAKLANSLRR